MPENDQILFKCAECGSKDFVLPNQPPNDDDIIKCSGCDKIIGRYAVIKEAATEAAKAEVDKMLVERFGKKPTWK
jgi:hypothetical protein